mmetsp:Transcript_46281/g.149163  ORF Transcript_46281/g.149163 Transcript_46281/m.149163 type:complete len:391 (-) Transcript_46281:521-1693(-)
MYFLMNSDVSRCRSSSSALRASGRVKTSDVTPSSDAPACEPPRAPALPEFADESEAGGGGAACCESTCAAIRRSEASSFLSRMMKRRSKRERSESGIPMFAIALWFLSYEPHTGFAAATTEQRALSDACMPALAMVTVCCSITSWMATRSASTILSNSSTQHTPRSASTIAPASSRLAPVSSSDVTAAVRPTPEEPRPVVEMARGAVRITARRSCDLAVDGSPSIRMLMSPRKCVPFARLRSVPPSSISSSARFSKSCPNTEGATDSARRGRASGRRETSLMWRTSSSVNWAEPRCFVRSRTWFPRTSVLKVPLWLALDGRARWMPVMCSRSPGLVESTRSASRMTSTERGSWPGGARSGISCRCTVWQSMYSQSPYSVSSRLPSESFVG